MQFTLVVVLACLFSLLFRYLKQPDILAFLLLGSLLGLFGPALGFDTFHFFEFFSNLGLTFLLFLVGLEMSTREIKQLGKPIALLSVGQLLLTIVISFLVGYVLLGSWVTAVYVAIGMSFSSTVVVLRLLSSKGEEQSLFGRLCVGVLLVQDLFAVLALILVTTYVPGEPYNWAILPSVIIKSAVLFSLVYYLSQKFFPWLFARLCRDVEALYLLGLAWALGLAAFVASPWMGFSIEIGGFLAGMALANSVQHYQIATRMRPLRDLFILVFFIYLGTHIDFSFPSPMLWVALALTVLAVVVKPIIVFGVLTLMNYRKRTSFLTAISLGQISEFSLILITLGERLGHVDKELLALMTIVGALSMTISTFLIHHADTLFSWFEPVLAKFERRVRDPLHLHRDRLHNHVVLVGYGRKGIPVLHALLTKGWPLLVVDTDPLVAKLMVEMNVPFLFGDINDEEIHDHANLQGAKLLISTAMRVNEDLALLSFLKMKRNKPKVIVTAKTVDEAKDLYQAGAYYVLLPQYVAGQFLAGMIGSKKDFLRSLAAMHTKEEKWFEHLAV